MKRILGELQDELLRFIVDADLDGFGATMHDIHQMAQSAYEALREDQANRERPN